MKSEIDECEVFSKRERKVLEQNVRMFELRCERVATEMAPY